MAITRIGTYSQIKGSSFKLPCIVATTTSITLSGTQTIDGVAVVAEDRVLVKNQGTGSENGIYIVSSGAWTRAVDMSLDDDLFEGLLVYINSGSTNGDKIFYLNTAGPISIGVTSLTFSVSVAATGTSGTTGTSGSSGTSGATGSSGSAGSSGTSGTSGSSGTSGTTGTSGTSGINGAPGTSGTSGVSGTSGTSGINGTSGTSGVDGTSGTSGVNGATGTNGTSGTSGSSGVSGGSAIGGTVTGGTTGSVLFIGASSTLAQDNANFFWDDTNNRLGIGTATPANTLDVIRGTAGAMGRGVYESASFSFNGDMKFGLYTSAAAGSGGSSLLFGATNFTAGGNYPGFEVQFVPSATLASNYIRFNSVGRNATGTVVSSTTDILSIFQAGNVIVGGNANAGFKLDVQGTGRYTGQLQSTAANSTTTGGGQLYLNGATGNRIDFNTNGVAAPAFTTRSAGTKLVLYPNIGASTVDYALGIESGTLWMSTFDTTTGQFKWYAGVTNILTLTGAGVMTLSRNQNAGTNFTVSNTTSGTASEGTIGVTSDVSSGSMEVGKNSTTTTTYKIITARNAFFYNGSTAGDIAILNDFATGTIKLAAGGSSTSQLVLKTTGQLQLNNYTSTSAFTGTVAGVLAFDSSGNIISSSTATATDELTIHLVAQTFNRTYR